MYPETKKQAKNKQKTTNNKCNKDNAVKMTDSVRKH